jgi:hypothetical protein
MANQQQAQGGALQGLSKEQREHMERDQKDRKERDQKERSEAKTELAERSKSNNPNTARFREYDEDAMPGMHPANMPADRIENEPRRKGTRLDLEDVTGNPGHRGVNPDAPANSINPPHGYAGDSINEPKDIQQNYPGQQGTTPLAGQGSHASINEPYGSTIGSNMPEDPNAGGGEDDVPELLDIDPDMAAIGDADVTLNCHGEGFTADSVITFNGGDEPTTFLSPTHVTTIVKPSTAGTPGEYPVTVKNAQGESEPLNFEFVEAARVAERKAKPKKPARESKKKKRK